ncbi:TIGR00730 family Rossman fold protein [Actinoplanes sp. NEAU-A12]|uniref:Cytokinin riboside 5'-monophosphate phosphoribohydrolase n=1 Tax=Actinoplanes sandaracinus TaxID=3045177 RepID=A0ABT6WIS9_9ACTN|nr:TIGR00730 family Rossman fold protein [Actinoplanes sandaracinus]MDI6099641.1 TIGR00730 family Rossman fold protein [Actinoplanes sandaracinus]
MAAVCVFCASSTTLEQRWLDLAADTGRVLAERGYTLVSGGGRVGMMGAVTEGARSAGGNTLGIIPQCLVDLEVADQASGELVVTTDMAARKNTMIDRSDAFLTLPGGLGTLDELFEVWTTATLDVHHKPMVLLDPDGFYDDLLRWLGTLVDQKFVRPAAMEMLLVARTVPEAVDLIEKTLAAGPGGGPSGAASGTASPAEH